MYSKYLHVHRSLGLEGYKERTLSHLPLLALSLNHKFPALWMKTEQQSPIQQH